MAKAAEVVQQGVQAIQAKLKEIKQADEEDLGKIAESFDDLSAQADELAAVLFNADKALSGQTDEDEDEQDDDDEEGDEEQADEPEQPQQRKRGRKQQQADDEETEAA